MATSERLARWRSRNADRIVPRVPIEDPERRRIATDLEREGIAIGAFERLFPPELWGEVVAAADRLRSRHTDKRPDDSKPFKAHLLDGRLRAEDPIARVALDEGILEIAASYLGMRPALRALDIWLTFPTPGPPVATQLWHRDGDDVMNVKLFVYLTEVREQDGPFCFAPRTHPVGEIRTGAASDVRGRSDDAQMSAVVPATDWLVCTGAAGTVILADTCGYHKQLKPREGERVLLMTQYTSGHPAYPPDVEISAGDPASLTALQHAAITWIANGP